MTRPVTKAVILTAGLGSRFLPMTKTIPKTMLPVVDKPVIQYLVEEAAASGIQDITIVISPGQEAVKAHFAPHPELEAQLTARGKHELIPHLNTQQGLQIRFVEQAEARGDGHAILSAREHLPKDEAFAILFGDDLVDHDTPALAQLIKAYEQLQSPVIATQEVAPEHIHNYGVINPESVDEFMKVQGLIEKPSAQEAPSSYGVIGKYIATPEVLQHLEESAQNTEQDHRLIDAFINMLAAGHELHALPIQGQRFDTGSKEGLLKANLHYGRKRYPEL